LSFPSFISFFPIGLACTHAKRPYLIAHAFKVEDCTCLSTRSKLSFPPLDHEACDPHRRNVVQLECGLSLANEHGKVLKFFIRLLVFSLVFCLSSLLNRCSFSDELNIARRRPFCAHDASFYMFPKSICPSSEPACRSPHILQLLVTRDLKRFFPQRAADIPCWHLPFSTPCPVSFPSFLYYLVPTRSAMLRAPLDCSPPDDCLAFGSFAGNVPKGINGGDNSIMLSDRWDEAFGSRGDQPKENPPWLKPFPPSVMVGRRFLFPKSCASFCTRLRVRSTIWSLLSPNFSLGPLPRTPL